MPEPQIAQLELLAQIDELVGRLSVWVEEDSVWEPMNRTRALLQRLLSRVETLRFRLEAPLIVATFGGTGTGKSTLVNAIIGEECTPAGRQRPTTKRPILIVHPQTEREALGLALDDFDIKEIEADILQDIVIIDCPDPDSDEEESPGSNIQRLHTLLPHCDLLIYTSTQQKYRSSRVIDE
ncbi:Putative ABC iron siderophore transporter, fused permease and ATPase domains, partial [hydrothermal vent metagenome]